MDAVEFLNQLYRRYKSNPDYYSDMINLNNMEPISFVAAVSTWAKEHPIKTRQSEFLKLYPNAPLNWEGILKIQPCDLDRAYESSELCRLTTCADCCKKYWLKEVE